MEIIKDNAIHVLNTSLAIGYPFVNSVNIGGDNSWYKGNIIDQTGMHVTKTPVFENY
jgi:hypothetical protein